MTPARQCVYLIAGTVALTAGGQIAEGKAPRLRLFIGGTAAAIVLSLLAGAIPTAARLFAVLVFLGALFGPGYSLIKAVTRLIT